MRNPRVRNEIPDIAKLIIKNFEALEIREMMDETELKEDYEKWQRFAHRDVLQDDSFLTTDEIDSTKMSDHRDGFFKFALDTILTIQEKYQNVLDGDITDLSQNRETTIRYNDCLVDGKTSIYDKRTALIALVAYIYLMQNRPDYNVYFTKNKTHMLTETKALFDEFTRIFLHKEYETV